MDITKGFVIERPAVFIPWGISEDELKAYLDQYLRHVTRGYYTISCVSLGGLEHELGFHFTPRGQGRLMELEIFRSAYPDMEESFREFQQHLEGAFGLPSKTDLPDSSQFDHLNGFLSYEWCFPRTRIVHSVFDRFGLEEHVRIKRV